MFKKIVPLVLLSFLLMTPVLAQEVTAELTSEAPTEVFNYELEGIEVDQIIKAPSSLGLWWRGVKENVSLAFTFDAVKKAEKSLKYAEERMQIAEKFSDLGENVKNQEKVQKNIEKAQKFMKKVELKKEKWLEDKNQEKVSNLIKNIANHQIRKEVIFDKLEEKLSTLEPSVDQAREASVKKDMEIGLEKIIDLRDRGLKSSQRLMNAIDSANIPEEIKEHLEGVKGKIESHAVEVKNYQQAKEELRAKIKQGAEGVEEDWNSLKAERKEQIRFHLEDFKDLIPSMNKIMEKTSIKAPVQGQESNMIQNRVNNSDEGNMEALKQKLQERNSNNLNTNQVEKQCLNFPGSDFCPSGIEDIIIVGYDENNCAIYDCQSKKGESNSLSAEVKEDNNQLEASQSSE